ESVFSFRGQAIFIFAVVLSVFNRDVAENSTLLWCKNHVTGIVAHLALALLIEMHCRSFDIKFSLGIVLEHQLLNVLERRWERFNRVRIARCGSGGRCRDCTRRVSRSWSRCYGECGLLSQSGQTA